MIRIIYICDISLHSHFVSDDNNPSQYAITCIFQPRCIPSWHLLYTIFRDFKIKLNKKLKPLGIARIVTNLQYNHNVPG